MRNTDNSDNQGLIESSDDLHRAISANQVEFFKLIAELDDREAWRDCGARDMAHWLWMRYGISDWKARRWIGAAHALKSLPRISEAFGSGELGIDKVVELTRLATPETESRLIPWAQEVSPGAIRHKGDLAARTSLKEARDADKDRRLWWWYSDEGRRFGLQAEFPPAQGAVVAAALDRVAGSLPVMPEEDDPYFAPARRADALVALASARIAQDPDPDRATVVIHVPLQALADGSGQSGGCEVGGDGVIHPQVVRRLLCDSRLEVVVEDTGGKAVGVGTASREPSAWMIRQLKHRDRGCTFPGCGTRRFTHAHHVVFWAHSRRTDLDRLVLVCSFHHKLVHEYGWRVIRDADGVIRWFYPDDREYRAGPGPPDEKDESLEAFSAAGL